MSACRVRARDIQASRAGFWPLFDDVEEELVVEEERVEREACVFGPLEPGKLVLGFIKLIIMGYLGFVGFCKRDEETLDEP